MERFGCFQGFIFVKLTVLTTSCSILCASGSNSFATISCLGVMQWMNFACGAFCNLTLERFIYSSQFSCSFNGYICAVFPHKTLFLIKKSFTVEDISSPVHLSFSGSQKSSSRISLLKQNLLNTISWDVLLTSTFICLYCKPPTLRDLF